ncbi:PLP-dependent transferase [Thozetella sp. PMI_491]|nr:PLP-dependent transferase [Thozetella sp. PMI_491]
MPPYSRPVEVIREEEYPHMNNGIYLDHSGATIYAKSTVNGFAERMRTSLLGNPHSANEPARVSGEMVDEVRAKTLQFLGADPEHFDLVFVANATAAVKLVADCFRDLAEKTRSRSFWYGYHRDCHTSLVGVRELTYGNHKCFESDRDVDVWLDNPHEARLGIHRPSGLGLFAYPGQSNLNGRRLPLSWSHRLRNSRHMQNTYSLFDAAALAMTSPMELVFADPDAAPDFTAVSFYKVFGFPDLGGLVVRKDSGHILALRKYFGGGTVTMVSAIGAIWHKSKGLETKIDEAGGSAAHGSKYSIHDGVEDGTLPFHSILALGEAIDVHKRLYGSMDNVSRHTSHLSRRLYLEISRLKHGNGQAACRIYNDDRDAFGDSRRQGATIAFNMLRPDGTHVAYSDVEKMANEQGIYVRSGGICCPGGLFTALGYEPWELDRAKSAGHHCGSDGLSLINQLPTGVVRASLGAMSTSRDVDAFVSFLHKTFVQKEQHRGLQEAPSGAYQSGLVNISLRPQSSAVSCAA